MRYNCYMISPYSLVERQRSSKPSHAGSNPARGSKKGEKNVWIFCIDSAMLHMLQIKWKMKILLTIILLGCLSCAPQIEKPVPCGYDSMPHLFKPITCRDNLYSVTGGECCTWKKHDCLETWCHNELLCKWQLAHYSCSK